jgi:methylmalonyl-CoA/ethylmalonyl-CoA epimerase
MPQDSGEKSNFNNCTQIGVVVRDLEETIARLLAYGIGPFHTKMPPANAQEEFRGQPFTAQGRVLIKAVQLGNIELELIQPLAGDSPHLEFLKERGEGLHHLAFSVDNLNQTANELKEQGATPMLTAKFNGNPAVAYMDLNAAGIIVEMCQKRK